MSLEKNEVLEKLKDIVAPYIQDKEAFEKMTESTHLLNDLKINSANLVDVILDVEDAFDIEIDDETAEKMMTVKDAVKVVLDLVED